MAALAVSCLPEQQSLDGAGQTLVKLFPSEFSLVPLDAKTTAQTGVLFEVRRDAHNTEALNSATTVILDYSDAILTKYNAANGKSFIPLPATLGTTDPAIVGGKITLNFAAGEFTKLIKINVPNASTFDFSKQYGLGFKLTEVTGTGIKSAAAYDTVVAQVLVKNKYDGKYKMKGFIMRPGDTGGLEGYFKDHAKTLATAGATSVSMSPNQLWANGGGVGGIGTWTFTVIESGTPPYAITVTDPVAVNWLMDPTYPNRYDPATKTFYFKVNWGAATNPYTRGVTDTLVWSGN